MKNKGKKLLRKLILLVIGTIILGLLFIGACHLIGWAYRLLDKIPVIICLLMILILFLHEIKNSK